MAGYTQALCQCKHHFKYHSNYFFFINFQVQSKACGKNSLSVLRFYVDSLMAIMHMQQTHMQYNFNWTFVRAACYNGICQCKNHFKYLSNYFFFINFQVQM